ncbi:hypothetical protein [Spirillospora sp. CA-294931]|uniref:hypothetical protein n=1 Tax=Spirillospora sp. CA-294931 TaxID=3240042 RepID=UPI003D8D0BA8
MNENEQLIYRLLLAVDIQAYSLRRTREQLLAQRQLAEALDKAAAGAGLDRNRWAKQVGGDGEMATLPEDVDPADVAGDFVIGLSDELRAINAASSPRLRVRLSLHHGTLTAGPFGPAGDAPIVVQRLLDSTPLRRLLIDDTERDVAFVVSDTLYEDVVRTGFCALQPSAFQRIKVKAKGAVFRGHIFVGGAQAGDEGSAAHRGGPGHRPAPGARLYEFPVPVPCEA